MDGPPVTRPRLTPHKVVEAACALADRDGMDALNLAKLADELGVRSPSLFNHVDGYPDLVRKMAALALDDLVGRITGLDKWEGAPLDRYHSMMDTYRGYVKAFPGRYEALTRVPAAEVDLVPELKAAETKFLGWAGPLARSLGWPDEQVVHAVRGWRALVHGFAGLEVRGGFGLPEDLNRSFFQAAERLARP
jgi:AcrR family transcriptional regulator